MEPTAFNLIAEVRQFLSRRLIEREVKDLGMSEVFFQSQSWEGYDSACDSWHDAYWKSVDQEAPAELVDRLKGLQCNWSKLGGFDWSRLPCAVEQRKSWLVEQTRQEILQQWALFTLAMRGPEAEEPETYGMFMDDMRVAERIGVGLTTYCELLAKQKQRKPTKDRGDRRLKYQLLLVWIPGCLWAFTTEGVAKFLDSRFPRSQNKTYNSKTIADARRGLKLYRSPKPSWWGITGEPPRLVSLR